MNLQFQGNYRIYGATPEAVNAKLEEVGRKSQVIAPAASMTAAQDLFFPDEFQGTDVKHVRYTLTDKDAVDFLNDQGIEATLEGGPEQRQHINAAVTNMTDSARQLYAFGLMAVSRGQEFVKENLTILKAE